MSIDLEWNKLDSSLADSLIDVLNRQLQNAPRPSFIGPVEITSFDFGSEAPDIELIDLRNVHPDFLEDDDDLDGDKDPVKVTEGAEDEDGFEWVPRRAVGRAMAEEAPAYHHLPPHIRYGHGPSSEMFTSTPSLATPRDLWNPSMTVPALNPRTPYPFRVSSPSVTPSFATAFHSQYASVRPTAMPSPPSPFSHSHSPSAPAAANPSSSTPPDASDGPPPDNPHPNLQLHLHITWHSNLRLTLATSLRINYPSPLFMSLPIRLAITGLLFTGELAVAYEGAGPTRRVHLCILDELDPYGPAGERPKRDSVGSAPGDAPDDDGVGGTAAAHQRAGKPLPIGQRLLPNIFIESELGQADKHVLKNVTRVERFIQDVIRKTVEEELVFPNFHTLVLG
ncbi:hypothetical protein EW146_g556 [Bondarzewia mesenterica]|uniref:Mitochondrial distribution and morphology protein 12 n=1 Tax=Bondarzewia mesenterica TaxID=1095465 RepID=A0A4S4M716_9AGAM|nr:hypothetical protein EW146_g556 [Bondarzewia mesenterica]